MTLSGLSYIVVVLHLRGSYKRSLELSVPSKLNAAHTLHTPPKLHTPSDVKKTESIQELDRLLNMYIQRLEDKAMSASCGSPRPHSARRSSPPSSLLSHSVPLFSGPSCGLADHGSADYGPKILG